MPPELTFNVATGVHEIIVARVDAWHKLGHKVVNCFTAEEGRRQAGLSKVISKYPLYRKLPDGSYRQNMDAWEVARDDNDFALGVVGPNYGIVQIPDLLALADSFVGTGAAMYDSLGTCYGGSLVFASLRLNELQHFSVGGDQHDIYLNVIDSYDRSKKLQVYLSTIRPVCKNTVDTSLFASMERLIFKHSKHVTDKVTFVTKENLKLLENQIVTTISRTISTLKERLQFLQSKVISNEAFAAYCNEVFPPALKRDTRRQGTIAEVAQLYASADNGQSAHSGTAYQLLEAIVEWSDFCQGVRRTQGRHTDDVSILRAESAVQGTGAQLKQRAMGTMMTFAQGLPDRPIATYSMPSVVTVPVVYADNIVDVDSVVVVTPVLDTIVSCETPLLDDILSQ